MMNNMDYALLSNEMFLSVEKALVSLEEVEENAYLFDICNHEFPFLHRIKDLELGNRIIRVCRCYSCHNRIFFRFNDKLDPDIGVPYELNDARIKEWVLQEMESPFKSDIDWDYFKETGVRKLHRKIV
jgi:hypothetical protein